MLVNRLSELLMMFGSVCICVSTYPVLGWWNIILLIGVLCIGYSVLIEV